MDTKVRRVIEIDDPQDGSSDVAAYYDKKTTQSQTGTRIVERYRDGDVMVITVRQQKQFRGSFGEESHEELSVRRIPAVIPFNYLLTRVVVENDDDCEVPWEDGDGWEHQIETFEASPIPDSANFRRARGYLQEPSRRDYRRVLVTDDSYCHDSFAQRVQYLRNKGASKQVARECAAQQDRNYIDQLVDWYNHGYFCNYVRLEVDIGGKIYEAACGGIEATDDATYDARMTIAEEVAWQLCKDGYTVDGYKAREASYAADRRDGKIRRLKYNLSMFNWR